MLPRDPFRLGLLLWIVVVLLVLPQLPALSNVQAKHMLPAQESSEKAETATAAAQPFGYGFVMADPQGFSSVLQAGFDWMLVFDPPLPGQPNALLRVKATVSDLSNLPAFRSRILRAALLNGVKGLQIGNEPNLISEWGAGPDAARYRQLLCEAYNTIKQARPAVIVVSGGLAPTGRVPGTWNGHAGHDGLKQDEREFLKEFIAAGGGNCLDAVGYNALGFRANYDAAPDVNGGTSETNCADGLCFRSVEEVYEIMQSRGLGQKPVWATEVGWLTAPPSRCLADPRWSNRNWQIVSSAKQSQNLVGAFRYARFHWPWMQAMFVFNLDFSAAPWYDECEQMRFYSVQGRPAYTDLANMSKYLGHRYLPLIRK